MIGYRLAHQAALIARPDPLRSAGLQARWNSEGVFITYLAEHPALAALEILNYAGQFRNIQGYVLFRVDVPDAQIEQVDSAIDPADYAQTRPYGDTWAQQQRSVGLRVPSVVAPESWNLLLNQRHPDFAALRPVRVGDFVFDARVQALVQ